jgi:hypothetical protein
MIETFDSEAGYRDAIDATIRAATRELRIFDGDLERMRLDEADRAALLLAFLADAPGRRLHIVVHDPAPIRVNHPRMVNLIRSHGHLIEVRRTPDHLRHLADRFVLADELHGTIRFHADHPRGKRISDDKIEIHPYWQRFDDLWEASQICTPESAAGL